MSEVSVYDRAGAHPTFVALVTRFYEGVATDPVLRPMYPEDLAPAIDRMVWFLEQYWGGPTSYSQNRGHPALRMRHAQYQINIDARDRWLKHMLGALDSLQLDDDVAAPIRQHLIQTADFLRNVREVEDNLHEPSQ